VRATLVLILAIVAVLVGEHTLEGDDGQAGDGADGGGLVAHDEGILHHIYGMSSRVLLNPQAVQPATLRVVISTHVSLSTESEDALMLTESISLVGEESVTGVIEVHMVSL